MKELEIDTYLIAFDEYENANEKVVLQIDEVESLETTITEIEEELNLTKTSVAYYKKTKLKESDKNKILTISEKINEFDLQPLVDEIAELTPTFTGVSFKRLDELGSIQWPCNEKAPEGTPIMHVGEFVRGEGQFMITDFVPTTEKSNSENVLKLVTKFASLLILLNIDTMIII